MNLYVVADVHGFLGAMKKALDRAGFFDDPEPHKLVICGDILDRGKEAKELVDFLCELQKKGMLVFVNGNHDDLFIKALQEIAAGGVAAVSNSLFSYHYLNGTWDSLLQLAEMNESQAKRYPLVLVERVRSSPFYTDLLPSRVNYYETEKYIFCHGWIPVINNGTNSSPKYLFDPDWRTADVAAWERATWLNGIELACKLGIRPPEKTVVCGHFHASYGHSKIDGNGPERGHGAIYTTFYGDGIIALDGCTVISGIVNCEVIKDEELQGQ
ncbi:MAG: metallophosphoesterase [Clostridia bacterium]|nr:metallophosphoesterase [Clostridia bacterium]